MNVKRFTARTSREALTLVRQAFGNDAVVLSTKPCAEGVEMLAMAPGSLQQLEQAATSAPRLPAPPQASVKQPQGQAEAVSEDVQRLSMSTLSFQDYVRERMLRRRQAALRREQEANAAADQLQLPAPRQAARQEPESAPRTALRSAAERAQAMASLPGNSSAEARPDPRFQPAREARPEPRSTRPAADPQPYRQEPRHEPKAHHGEAGAHRHEPLAHRQERAPSHSGSARAQASQSQIRREPPVLRDEVRHTGFATLPVLADVPDPVGPSRLPAGRREPDMMSELRSMKGLIEERFGALAFMEKLQRQPAHARLTQKLLDCGFSPMLIRKLVDGMGAEVTDEIAWATSVLERNLLTGESDPALEDQGGVLAMIGSTGVGKTTSTAKIAAAFATRHGAGNLGLITLDAYRVGAHEQLRAYGRILGVPVYTAHDRATLEDLLDLLSAKKMVLIDTAGIAQRDSRTAELLDMLGHRSIEKLLVVNAASQGETIEDVLMAYRASAARGIVLSKMDEAVKLGPAVDALIRHKLKVLGVANGQRVPEDWHRLSGQALIQRALRSGGSTAYRMDASDVNLVFAASPLPGQQSVHAPSVNAVDPIEAPMPLSFPPSQAPKQGGSPGHIVLG